MTKFKNKKNTFILIQHIEFGGGVNLKILKSTHLKQNKKYILVQFLFKNEVQNGHKIEFEFYCNGRLKKNANFTHADQCSFIFSTTLGE